jgi:hypothetical protein
MFSWVVVAAAFAPEKASDPVSAAWVTGSIALAVGVASAVTTVLVTWLTLRARSRDLAKDREAAEKRWVDEQAAARDREERDRVEAHRIERAEAYEDIIHELAAFTREVNAEIARVRPIWEASGKPVAFKYPNHTGVLRALSKFTTRMGLPEMFEATSKCLQWGRELDALNYPSVVGILQERIDLWFVERRSLDETLALLALDAESYGRGELPPSDGDMPPSVKQAMGA